MALEERFRIGDWLVEAQSHRLVRADHPEHSVRIEPKAMQVLLYLARHAGVVVQKDQVVREVWEGTFVTDEVLTNAVWELRKALGDDPKDPKFIETVPRKGYRLVASVRPVDTTEPPPHRGRELGGPSQARAGARALPWILLGVGLTIIVLAVWHGGAPGTRVSRPVARFRIDLDEPLAAPYLPATALSPDGSRLVYVADIGDGTTELYLRAMDRMESSPIAGTRGGHGPFFSTDGLWVGFYAGGTLKRVKLDEGSPPETLFEVSAPRGATWGPDDKIYFTPGSSGGIWRISAGGGEREIVTELEEGEWTHRWPQVLPNAKAILFTVGRTDLVSGFDEAAIVAQSLETGERRVLVEGGSFGRYAQGRLIYSREGVLMAASFDADRLELSGTGVPALEGIQWFPINGTAQYDLSLNGSLAYVPGDGQWEQPRRLVWVDRRGDGVPVSEQSRIFYDPALSPDGRKVAVSIAHEGNTDLWIYDRQRDTLTRLTSTGGEEQGPIWTPDGRRVTYYYSMAGPFQMFWRPANGSEEAERLLEGKYSQRPESWSPDGRVLVFSENHERTGFDLWSLEMDGDRKSRPLLVTSFDELQGRVSPDGRWLAYVSNESGRIEVYVRPFPGPGGKWQISTEGGDNPIWAPDGEVLYYLNRDRMMAVDIGGGPELSVSKPKILFEWRYPLPVFEGRYRRRYDIAPDGEHFVMIQAEQESSRQLFVVLHWLDELKQQGY